jgi:hypothetical protein
MADCDWRKQIDRELLEQLLKLDFLHKATNVIQLGPNGVGKTMIAKNQRTNLVPLMWRGLETAITMHRNMLGPNRLPSEPAGSPRLARSVQYR